MTEERLTEIEEWCGSGRSVDVPNAGAVADLCAEVRRLRALATAENERFARCAAYSCRVARLALEVAEQIEARCSDKRQQVALGNLWIVELPVEWMLLRAARLREAAASVDGGE